jgi:hypothetical protein
MVLIRLLRLTNIIDLLIKLNIKAIKAVYFNYNNDCLFIILNLNLKTL